MFSSDEALLREMFSACHMEERLEAHAQETKKPLCEAGDVICVKQLQALRAACQRGAYVGLNLFVQGMGPDALRQRILHEGADYYTAAELRQQMEDQSESYSSSR